MKQKFVQLRFVQIDMGSLAEIEVHAIDFETAERIVALPIKGMGAWLVENKYRPVLGSNGIWQQA